jgi:hypothetical protein
VIGGSMVCAVKHEAPSPASAHRFGVVDLLTARGANPSTDTTSTRSYAAMSSFPSVRSLALSRAGCGSWAAIGLNLATGLARNGTRIELSSFDVTYNRGTLPHDLMARSIELRARELIPAPARIARRG